MGSCMGRLDGGHKSLGDAGWTRSVRDAGDRGEGQTPSFTLHTINSCLLKTVSVNRILRY